MNVSHFVPCLVVALFLGGCRASDQQSPPVTNASESDGGGVVTVTGTAAVSTPADMIAAILANGAEDEEEWKIVNDDPGCVVPGDEWYEEMYREHSGKKMTLANLLGSLIIEQARERPQVWEVNMSLVCSAWPRTGPTGWCRSFSSVTKRIPARTYGWNV